jgi:2-polyprenyl-3-methyl-5-hydroxy-6-metoxy-1,4-benzoquinol methylase
MSESERVRAYFARSAVPFDSLYGEERMNPVWRWINQTFRRDIYERFLRTVEHARRHKLESALDVGCGSGRYALGLAEAGVERIVGVDFSQPMIDLAVRNTDVLANQGVDVEFHCQDFMEFETDEQFDFLLAMGVFDYIEQPERMLGRMRKLARHSVVASFPSISIYRTPIRQVRYAIKRCPVYFYRPDRIDRVARSAGFALHETTKIAGSGMDYFAVFYV